VVGLEVAQAGPGCCQLRTTFSFFIWNMSSLQGGAFKIMDLWCTILPLGLGSMPRIYFVFFILCCKSILSKGAFRFTAFFCLSMPKCYQQSSNLHLTGVDKFLCHETSNCLFHLLSCFAFAYSVLHGWMCEFVLHRTWACERGDMSSRTPVVISVWTMCFVRGCRVFTIIPFFSRNILLSLLKWQCANIYVCNTIR
jgi:hypothetical protein